MAEQIYIPPTIKPEEKKYLENCGIIFGDLEPGYLPRRESYKIDLPENWTIKTQRSSTEYTEVFDQYGIKVFDTNIKSTSYDYFLTFDFNKKLLPEKINETEAQISETIKPKDKPEKWWNRKIW